MEVKVFMTEATLMIDSYGRNVEYTGDTAMVHQIYHLVVMDKGTDELNPDKGIGIKDYYYEYTDDTILMNLENAIQDQISTYTPYTVANVICKAIKNSKGDYILHVFISLSEILQIINVSTNGEKNELALMEL